MDSEKLNQLYQELHTEVEHAESLSEQDRETLHRLMADIRCILEECGEVTDLTDHSFLDHLSGSLDHFEVTHPTLTLSLGRLFDFLNGSGI